MTNISDVRTIVVENWLKQLRRRDGNPLTNTTKAKIRNLMSVLFNHAIRHEWLEQGKNPITLVRQSAGDGLIEEHFATSVATNGSEVLVSAPGKAITGPSCGAVYYSGITAP